MKLPRWIVLVMGVLAPITGCVGDPYSRYGAVVHADVDGAMVAALRMTARMQLTVVHDKIPDDSLAVVATIVRRAYRGALRGRSAPWRSRMAVTSSKGIASTV